ncbi:MAG: hypothetical protein M3N31_09310 [Actinomycetota bacterium]|nr:hypothetical protein [Actinomycetota bacterium]
MSAAPERLYNLLPAVYRLRDATQGEPLRALLGVVEQELGVVEADIEQLYDNWFIETCQEWVVAYLGDLLGVSGLAPLGEGVSSQRGFVANTLAYRRAKGTAAVLEQLSRDLTGWPAKAVEYFEHLATTRHLNHTRRYDASIMSIKDADRAELTGTPHEQAAHTAEVRHIDNGRGRYNIENVGLHLWRLQPYYVTRSRARAVEPDAAGRAHRFTFSPLGLDSPLFNVPREETSLSQLAGEANVPGRLRRRPLHDELEARRQALVDSEEPEEVYFDDRQPVVRVWLEEGQAQVPPEEILVCDLSSWRRPPDEGVPDETAGHPVTRQPTVAIDPVLGRLTFPPGVSRSRVEVSFAYGSPGDLGGGPYRRDHSVAQALGDRTEVTWQRGITRDPSSDTLNLRSSLGEAVTEWNRLGPGHLGVIALMDSRTHEGDLHVELKAGSRLVVVAADWPTDATIDNGGVPARSRGRLTPTGLRPHVLGRIDVTGTASRKAEPGQLVLDGLLVEGGVEVLAGNLGSLRMAHCTLPPPAAALRAHSESSEGRRNDRLAVTVERSITGRLDLGQRLGRLRVVGSIVDDPLQGAIEASDAEVEASTVFGPTSVRTLVASNAIFAGLVKVDRRQAGCVRYSYLPSESVVPRRFRCQPRDSSARTVAPAFTSTTYGEPAYAQLSAGCPPEIARGGEEEGEMGAFSFLHQPKRLANLTARLDEYLRFGLEAGIFFVT